MQRQKQQQQQRRQNINGKKINMLQHWCFLFCLSCVLLRTTHITFGSIASLQYIFKCIVQDLFSIFITFLSFFHPLSLLLSRFLSFSLLYFFLFLPLALYQILSFLRNMIPYLLQTVNTSRNVHLYYTGNWESSAKRNNW